MESFKAADVDGRFLYVSNNSREDKTFVIAVAPGTSLPELPAKGLTWDPVPDPLPDSLLIEEKVSWPGPDPSTYIFMKTDLQRNLYRIPLH